jgi:hypothetical protein
MRRDSQRKPWIPCQDEQTRVPTIYGLFMKTQYGYHLTKLRNPAYPIPQEVASLRVSVHIR